MQEDDGKKIYYKNMVYLKVGLLLNDMNIVCDYYEVILFSCGYDKKVVLLKVLYNFQIIFVFLNVGVV